MPPPGKHIRHDAMEASSQCPKLASQPGNDENEAVVKLMVVPKNMGWKQH